MGRKRAPHLGRARMTCKKKPERNSSTWRRRQEKIAIPVRRMIEAVPHRGNGRNIGSGHSGTERARELNRIIRPNSVETTNWHKKRAMAGMADGARQGVISGRDPRHESQLFVHKVILAGGRKTAGSRS